MNARVPLQEASPSARESSDPLNSGLRQLQRREPTTSLSLELSLGNVGGGMTAQPAIMISSHNFPESKVSHGDPVLGRACPADSNEFSKEADEAACQLRTISGHGSSAQHGVSCSLPSTSASQRVTPEAAVRYESRVDEDAATGAALDTTGHVLGKRSPDNRTEEPSFPSTREGGEGREGPESKTDEGGSTPCDDGNGSLSSVDPDVWRLIELEKERQFCGIELIASENFVSQSVMEALGSAVCNKYSEGQPGARYYGGNQHIDALETLCRERALKAFHLDPEEWGVNVQPYSCTSANLAVFAGLLNPRKDRIMGLDLPSGGHMSHGYYTPSGKRVAAASVFFETLPYKVSPTTGLLDYEKMEEKAMEYRPKLMICGGSSYPRVWDFARCRQIADRCGAVLMCDMAHISGLVAAGEHPSPFDHVDIVTSTTHKTMRGPRGGIIFFRRGPVTSRLQRRRGSRGMSPLPAVVPLYDYEDRINFAVFPMMQGGPHNNHTAALAVSLKQVGSEEYAEYMRQVRRNATALAAALVNRGCRLVTGGTDNHMIVWDVRPLGITGQRMEKVGELCGISLNKCPIYGDAQSAPGGVRVGTPALTTRGCKEAHMEIVAEILVRAAQISQRAVLEAHQMTQLAQIKHETAGVYSPKHGHAKQEPETSALTHSLSSGSPLLKGQHPCAHESGSAPRNGSLPQTPRVKRSKLNDWIEGLGKTEEVRELRAAVHEFACGLPMPGFGMGYKVGDEKQTAANCQ